MSFFNRIRPDPGFVSPVRSDPGFVSPIRCDPVRSDPDFVNGLLRARSNILLAGSTIPRSGERRRLLVSVRIV